MNYLIGLDGGGTKTHCIVCDINFNIVFESKGGPSNFLIIGTEKVSETLFNIISEAKEKLNADYSDFKSILLGTTGAGRKADADKLEKDFLIYAGSKGVNLNLFKVDSDARIALEGAFSGNPGSILIAGTGSIIFGKDRSGNIHRAGGFGRAIGDQGSGNMLGRKCLIAVSKEYDGRGEKTILTGMIKEIFNIASSEDLINEIYKNNFDIATAAPLIIEAAENSDDVALRIIEEETDELLLHISAIKNKINEDILDVAFIGGLLSSDNFYSKRLKEKIYNKVEEVRVKEPEHLPAMGAVFMAKQLLSQT